MKWLSTATVVALSLFGNVAHGIELDLESSASVKEAAGTIAFGLMRFYTGNNTGDTPGNLPDPYFWWEAGAMFGTMVDYWAITGDDSYNDVILQALVHNAGENSDYNPANHSLSMGNDDQGFWAMAAMSAAENRFPNPPRTKFKTCGGGLRWQVFHTNKGFDYKNSISNGCLFNVAARLARYTGNNTYLNWAERVWEWEDERGLISDSFEIRDGTHISNITNECESVDQNQWSYNAGIFLYGAAVMYNVTEDQVWRDRIDGVLANIQRRFFQDGIMFEQICEPFANCNIDQRSFKGYLTRWMAWTTRVAPYTYDTIHPLLLADAEAAASICTGTSPEFRGHPGTGCGMRWTTPGVHDGLYGVGEQMNALSAVMYTLMDDVDPPATLSSGATSPDDPTGGTQDVSFELPDITTGDRVGAGILTVLYMASCLGFTSFLVL
ncbi:mannan endo-1,6-alpha-mannosidase DCW1 [Stachybotrys elegans]|uniref:Mannan endo-1,6-alpha-mannosidase n=1 Tax=Stachybotrys elegans TaxID=80388 RepID=A0A8K0SQ22_9HYPO|nr:mannan endo-1,6-alpha-mannosidase DCW1 [Stachybotrys elegans]